MADQFNPVAAYKRGMEAVLLPSDAVDTRTSDASH